MMMMVVMVCMTCRECDDDIGRSDDGYVGHYGSDDNKVMIQMMRLPLITSAASILGKKKWLSSRL